MGFTAPLGLLALLAVPAVVVLHLFRRRFRERKVAGLFLFAADALPAEAGRTRARLLRTPSLWLELLGALLLGLWLGGFHLGAPAADRHLVVVLDDSASMGAVGLDGSLSALAQTHVERAIDDLGRDGRVTLVTTGRRPAVLAGPKVRVEDARRALRTWAPSRTAHDPAPAWELGLDLAGADGQALYVTDREDLTPPPRFRHLAVGTSLPNAAVVGARRMRRGDSERVYADVLAWGSEPVQTTVHVEAVTDEGTREIVRKEITLTPGRALHLAWTVPAGDIPFHVRLADDALAVDNVARLLPDPRRVVPVHLAVDGDMARDLRLERVMRALEGVRLVKEPAFARLVVASKSVRAGRGTVVLEVAPLGKERDAWIGPFLFERAHVLGGREGRPVLAGLSLEGVVWSAGRGELPGLALIRAGEQVLLSEEVRARTTWLRLNLDPSRSNLAGSPDWPILLTNIVEHVRSRLPGPTGVNVRLGGELGFRFGGSPEEAATHAMFGPRGDARPARGWRYLSWEAREVGMHRLRRGETEVARYAVNFVDPQESDLIDGAALDAPATEAPRVTAAGLGSRGALEGRVLALLLLLAICLDWFVLGRRR